MYNDSSFAEGYAIGRDSNNGYNNGMFGGDWAWWIIILLIFGWGGNGFGFGNNGGGFMNGALTRGDLCQDMNFNNLEGAVRGISQGICDSTFALNNTITSGFSGVQQSLCQGFNGTQREIADLGYQLQSCCCQTQRAIDGVNYNLATNTNSIIQSNNANTQRILDYLCQEKISGLQAENALLTSQLSQNSQTATLLGAINRTPVPAYVVANPYANNCGCNTGCGCC